MADCEVASSDLDDLTLFYLRKRKVTDVSVDYTPIAGDDIIRVIEANVTITLPTAVGAAGCQFTVKRFTPDGDIMVAAQAGEYLDYDDVRIFNVDTWAEIYVSDGVNWVIVT